MALTVPRLYQWLLTQLDSLSSAQLYVIIVVATVALCFALLGTGGNNIVGVGTEEKENTTKKMNTETIKKTNHSVEKEPQWHILLYVNVLITLGFLASVIHFSFHASTYWQDSQLVFQFLVGWSIFLCYFFGFFGISFVHDQLVTKDDGANHHQQQERELRESGMAEDKKKKEKKAEFCHRGEVFKMTKPDLSKSSIKAMPVTTCEVAVAGHDSRNTKIAQTNITVAPDDTPASKKIANVADWSNDDIYQLVLTNQWKDHELESRLDPHRAVVIRRMAMNHKIVSSGNFSPIATEQPQPLPLDEIPSFPSLDYGKVYGANCEVVIGYVPIPIGLVGPLTMNGESGIYIPMATTEGCLVASTNRGIKAITEGSGNGGGAQACILRDGITRAPCVRMSSAMEAAQLAQWVKDPENALRLKQAFESTTSFGKLCSIIPTVAGKNVYLRLECFSGDAMGMNMVSKGSLAVIELLQREFPSLQLVALSGNMCTDKKASATNWIHGRGKSVVVEAVIPKHVVHRVLKTTVSALVHVNLHKNLIGSAMAGTAVGGFNAHASNIVTAIFLATGQDPAQNVESSNCITLMEETPDTGDLWISCTMPSLEVGTVGGGTSLQAQAACLGIMNCRGSATSSSLASSIKNPGDHAQRLAKIIATATMAGELSLMAALAANTLVQAHMTHNRKK